MTTIGDIAAIDSLLAEHCGSKCLDDDHDRREVASFVATRLFKEALADRDRWADRVMKLERRLQRITVVATGLDDE
jgi:hypothetical protein